jgi:hypothetical protein
LELVNVAGGSFPLYLFTPDKADKGVQNSLIETVIDGLDQVIVVPEEREDSANAATSSHTVKYSIKAFLRHQLLVVQ